MLFQLVHKYFDVNECLEKVRDEVILQGTLENHEIVTQQEQKLHELFTTLY